MGMGIMSSMLFIFNFIPVDDTAYVFLLILLLLSPIDNNKSVTHVITIEFLSVF